MAIIRYSVRLLDPYGVPLAEFGQFVRLSYTLSVSKVGALELEFAASVDMALFALDGRLGVWRSINGRPATLDGDAIYLIQDWRYTQQTTVVIALHATTLLRRRIVNYYAGSSYADKAAQPADDLIKEFVNENMGSGIVTADRIGAETGADLVTAGYLTIQADLGLGASIAKAAAWRNLAEVVADICAASTEAGTYLACEIVAPTEGTLELRTYTDQRGVDHRSTAAQPVILETDRWNLQNVALVIAHADEQTVVTAGGQGEKSLRATATSSDDGRVTASPFNRKELFLDATNTAGAAALQDSADAAVRSGRARITFTGDLVDTDGLTRGIQYDYGDYVTAVFRGNQYDVRLDVVAVTVTASDVTQQVQLRYDGPVT